MASIRNFCIRTAHSKLLREFFHRHGVDFRPDDLAPDADAKAIATAADKHLRLGTRSVRDAIVSDIVQIEKLASEYGEVALEQRTLTEHIADLPSRSARALHIFLFDGEGFKRAEEIIFNDTLRGGKQWTAFPAEKGLILARDDAAIARLTDAMRIEFNARNIHLEIFDRVRPNFQDDDADEGNNSDLVQITIYRESRPNAELAFIDGSLGTEIRFAVLEAAVTYESSTGMIECVSRDRDDRAELARLLATTVLGCSPDFKPIPARAYDLSVLQQRMKFQTEPVDRIERVEVSMLRLVPTETGSERITVETTPRSEEDIWTVVEQRLGSQALQSDFTIDQAKIVIRYRPAESNTVRSLPVTITHPHRSNLKERTEIERAVAGKYLPKWGLVAA